MIIFDTDTLTHFSFGKQSIKDNLDKYPAEPLAVTVITWYEAMRGRGDALRTAVDGAQLMTAMVAYSKTHEMLKDFQVVNVDEEAASHFDRLLKQKKLKMRRADMLIACIVLSQKALLVTGNIKDFLGLAGLRVEDWSK